MLILLIGILLPVASPANNDSALKAIDESIRHRNYDRAIKQLQPLLRQNLAEAEFRMAGLYRSGRGVKMNLQKAIELYEKAAIRGHADAQYMLASILEKQHPMERKRDEALQWYRAAAELEHPMAIAKLDYLRSGAALVNEDELSQNDIFEAIRKNDLRLVRALEKRGNRLDFIDDNGRSTLLTALYADHHEMSRLLLEHSSRADKADNLGNRPLHIAVRNGYRDIVFELINKRVNIDARDNLGNTALMIATRHDNDDLMRLLLANHADHRISNDKRQTAPEIAQMLNLDAAKSVFSELGIALPAENRDYAEVDIKALQKSMRESSSLYKGWPPLSIAALLGETAMVEQLLDRRARVDATDGDGNTALHRAASKGRRKVVEMLIANGCNINAVNHANETALYLAAQAGQLKTVRLLLNYAADPAIVAKDKTSPLYAAIAHGHPLSAGELLEKPIDPASIHDALLLAIDRKMESLALRILERDDRLHLADDENRSVLWHSVDLGLEKVSARLLRKKRVAIDQADSNGYTPLARAVASGHAALVRLLLDNGASAKVRTAEKNTLLMLAAVRGRREITELLLTRDIDVNAVNNLGNTALMMAAANGFDTTIDILLKAGADSKRRNLDEQNAYDIAMAAGHNKTAELIRERSNIIFKLFN